MKIACAFASLCFLFGFGVSPAIAGIVFTPLGTLNGLNESHAIGVSDNGEVVTGGAYGFNGTYVTSAFRWSADDGMTGLGNLPGATLSVGWRLSGDGSVIVGETLNNSGVGEGFRWTSNGGMQGLGFLDGGNTSGAIGVSTDGTVIAGYATNSVGRTQAIRWTDAGGMQGLGFLSSNDDNQALDISGDGSVIVGGSFGGAGQAFRWTESSGMVGLGHLGHLPGGDYSYAFSTSMNGSVIVGGSNGQAYRWTESGGMVGLGYLPGGGYRQSGATSVSGDGSTIVGFSNRTGNIHDAFVWTEPNGLQSIRDLLIASNIDMTGWTLNTAYGISKDGNTIVGSGTNNGLQQAWRVQLSSVPEPSGLLIAGTLFSLTLLPRRRGKTFSEKDKTRQIG